MTKQQIKLIDDEYAQQVSELIQDDGTEAEHAKADEILCDLLRRVGFKRTCDIYDKIGKWYA